MAREQLFLSVVFAIGGVSSLCFGLAGVKDGVDLFSLRVGGSNQECVYHDCETITCQPGDNPNSCRAQNDYPFQAAYTCETKEGATCNRKDFDKCYDFIVCVKNPLKACNTTNYCTNQQNCQTVTAFSYDNCSG